MTDKEVLLLRRKLDLLLRTGKLLMESAADTNRIERNMKRVAAFMGIPEEKLHIDIRWTMIMVNVSDERNSFSKFQKCEKHGINMTMISQISDLSWHAIEQDYSLDRYEEELEKIACKPRNYIPYLVAIGAGFACGGFCKLFGCDWIAFLFASLPQINYKTRYRVLYAIAIIMLFAVIPISEYMSENTKNPNSNYLLVLIFDIAVGYFCMYIAALLKFNVLKRKNQALENALTEKQQENVAILLEHQNEKQQVLQQRELEWLADKIKMFTEEEQKAILASACAFAEHGLIIPPSITIQQTNTCSQQDLMYFVCSAFFNMSKKRSDIVSFLSQVFPLYFPAGESVLAKKMPGWERVKERRERERKKKK